MILRTLFLSFIILVSANLDAQTVNLSRLQRALGADSVIVSNASGKAEWKPVSVLPGGGFGSALDSNIAMWLNDTLTASLMYQGADSTLYFYYRGTNNAFVIIDGGGGAVRFDMDADGTTDFEVSEFNLGGTQTGDPQMNNNLEMFFYNGDTDTGYRRTAANIAGLHAGDQTNPMLETNGTNDRINIDPNDDATDDIILNDTMAIFEKVKVGIHTDVTTQALAGYDSLNVMSRIIIGNGLTLTPGASYDTLTASSSGATDLTIGGSGPTYTVESSTGSDVTISVAGIASLSEPSANELRITATEVDGSITNEIQSISVTGTTTAVIDLSDDATDASITGAGISTVSVAGNAITITSTEVDGSTSNELQDLTIGGSGPTYTVDIANGADVTIAAAGINTLSEGTANVLTITGTEVDGSITNEIQQLTPSDNGTNFWWALGSSTDSIVLVEGTNITMSRSGDNVTINAASGVTGSGTTGEVAVWSSSSALTSNGWSMTATEFQAGSAGDPRLEASNNFYTFNSDTDTGVKRGGANVLSLHAGDASNNMVELDGTNDRVTFDPNDDATDDIIFRDTMALFEKIYLSTPSAALTTTLTGYDAGNILTEIIIGSGLTLVAGVSNDTLTATAGSDDQQITPGDNGTNFWFALEGSTDSIVLVEGTNVTMSRSGDNVTINAASGVTGSGVATAIATWATASTLTNTDWIILSNTMSGPTLGDPAMSITDNIYSFTGDSDTGIKWASANVFGLHASDATNATVIVDGGTNVVTVDPDDDGVYEVSIADARTEFEHEVRVDVVSSDNTTHLASMDAEEDIAKVAAFSDDFQYSTGASVDTLKLLPSFGQLSYNGSFEITNTSSDTLDPDFSWTELESGVISADDATHSLTTNFAGYAEVSFVATLYNESGSNYTGYVNFELYKNGSNLAPFAPYVQRIANGESKDIHLTGLFSVANGDDFHIRAYLSTAGTIDISTPIFNIKKL